MIIGTERSGSNLLRLVLNSHSRIAIPHPPHFMRYLAPIAASYGDLAEEGNRRALVRDALKLLHAHIHPWEHEISEERVVVEAQPSLFGVVAAIYDQYRRAEAKARWGCKSTFMVDHVAEVLSLYPAAQFIWLVRDPRDVASSAKRSVFGPCHPYLTARLWVSQQARGLAALDAHGPDVIHLLRYEDLVSSPERSVAQVSDFLGERLEPTMLEHHRSDAARRTASLCESWRNTDQPITTRQVGRYQVGLSTVERLQVEQQAGHLMARFGYVVDEPFRQTALPSLVAVRSRDLLLRARVEVQSMESDRNHRRRWLGYWTVEWLRIKGRVRLVAKRATRSPGGD